MVTSDVRCPMDDGPSVGQMPTDQTKGPMVKWQFLLHSVDGVGEEEQKKQRQGWHPEEG